MFWGVGGWGGVGRVDTPIHTMKPGSFQFYRNALTHSTQSNCSIHFLTRNFKTKFFTDICIFRKMITLNLPVQLIFMSNGQTLKSPKSLILCHPELLPVTQEMFFSKDYLVVIPIQQKK